MNSFKNGNYSEVHGSLLTRMIARSFSEYTGGELLSTVHIDAICNSLKSKSKKELSLPLGIKCITEQGKWKFTRGAVSSFDIGSVELKNEGEYFFGDGVVITLNYVFFTEKVNINKFTLKVALCCDNIKGNLYARQRKTGDKLTCCGVTRSVKKELINLKIASSLRNRIPVICDDDGIVFVPYIGAADRVYCLESGRSAVYIDVRFEDERDGQ